MSRLVAYDRYKPRPDNQNTSMWSGQGQTIFGLIICVVLFSSGFIMQGNIGLYFNLCGLFIVIGGTAGATLISFRFSRLVIVCKVLRGTQRAEAIHVSDIVEALVDLSVKSKLHGLLSLQEDEQQSTQLFLQRALGMLVDGYTTAQIRDFLNTEMYFFKMRRGESERVLRTMADFCPSFGLVGSVVGLIGMLAGIGDTSTILSTIPVALTSTLYGIVLANFVFSPLAVKISENTNQELKLQKIILEGVIAIGSELHPRALEIKLKSFLTPSQRKGRIVSIERIRERFNVHNGSNK